MPPRRPPAKKRAPAKKTSKPAYRHALVDARPAPAEIRARARELVRGFIERVGWGVLWVASEPPLAYTVGLTQSFGHPEVLTYGMGQEDSQGILNDLAKRVQQGERFAPGQRDDRLIRDYPALLLGIPRARHEHVVNIAHEWYRGTEWEEFEVLQLVWPDPAGHFFYDADFDHRFDATQPILGSWDAPH